MSSYQNLATGPPSTTRLIGLYHSRTIRLSVRIWLAATMRFAVRSRNTFKEELKLLYLMCRQIVKSYIIHPLYLMAAHEAPRSMSFLGGTQGIASAAIHGKF